MNAEGPIIVVWRDASFHLDEYPMGDYLVHTAGWLIEEGPIFFVIASEHTPEGPRAYTAIPLASIVEVIGDTSPLGGLSPRNISGLEGVPA